MPAQYPTSFIISRSNKRALLQALRFDQLAGAVQFEEPRAQFIADLIHRLVHPFLRGHVMRRGVHGEPRHLAQHLARERIEVAQGIDLVVEQLDPHRLALRLGREDVDDIAAHPIGALLQVDFIARVLHVRQAPQQLALLQPVAARHVQHHAQVRFRVAQPIDRRHGRDDDGVRPLEQRLGRRQTHLLDVLVDRGILLDEGVRGRHIGLGLVVVVVGDEVLDRVLRKEHLELAVQLRRQRLVVREHQRRPLHLLDHVGDGEGLAGAGHPQQGLVRQAAGEPIHKFFNRLRLITRRQVVRKELETHVRIVSR